MNFRQMINFVNKHWFKLWSKSTPWLKGRARESGVLCWLGPRYFQVLLMWGAFWGHSIPFVVQVKWHDGMRLLSTNSIKNNISMPVPVSHYFLTSWFWLWQFEPQIKSPNQHPHLSNPSTQGHSWNSPTQHNTWTATRLQWVGQEILKQYSVHQKGKLG